MQALPDEAAALPPAAVPPPTGEAAAQEAVSALPDVAPGDGPAASPEGRPLVAGLVALLAVAGAMLLTGGWAVARRAGLPGRALRF